ncbi:MAG TPA: DUF5658 family protein [Bryobacteraceae bacterium]|nr:DUF5658 family protein [Bryobacteraceae bacterium]
MTKVVRHLLSRLASSPQLPRPRLGSNAAREGADALPASEAHALPGMASPMTVTLLNYAYLQVLDLLTTSAFLLAGVREANPLVLFAIRLAPNALVGLVAVKSMAIMLGLVCWWTSRARLLLTATAFYAVLVA